MSNIERDGDGFLLNVNEWTEEVMYEMAKEDGFEITDEVKEYIDKAREMYEADGVVPPLRVFSKATGGDRKGTHLNKAFGGGPMKVIAKYGGLPKPTGCV